MGFKTSLLVYTSGEPAELLRTPPPPLDPAQTSARQDGVLLRSRPGQPTRYRVSFHPLELGETVLHALMGFTRGGPPAETDVEASAVRLIGFEVAPANPITPADIDEFVRTHTRTRYTLGPGGSLIPVTD